MQVSLESEYHLDTLQMRGHHMAVKFTLYVCFVFYKLSWMRILRATNEMLTVQPTFLALAGFTYEVWQSQHVEQQATMPLCIARPYYEAKRCSTSLP